LKSVKIYILLGYFTLIIIASITIWVIYNETVDLYKNQVDINPVSDKIFIANSILTNLYEAEGLERSFLQTGNPKHYEEFNLLIDSISKQINLLGSIKSIPSQQLHTDSIQALLIKKKENLEELNSIKNSASSERLYERAMYRLTEKRDSLNKLFSVATTVNTSTDSIFAKHRRSKFFERLVHVFTPPEETDSTLLVVKNKSVQVDSIYNAFSPTDSVEQFLTSIIEDVRKETIEFENQLLLKEQENLKNNQTITLQIRQILSKLENEELMFSLRKVAVQQGHISKMTNIVIILGAAALVVVLGFLMLILKDITRSQHYRQNLEKEKTYSESLLKSKRLLMLSITHDLKSPLNSIAGFTQLAARETSPVKQSNYLKNINQSVNYISRLINDLLDFARLETGNLTVEKHSVNLQKLIEEVALGFYPMASGKNLNLELQISDINGKNYNTDSARIIQILSNLISNAIKFTDTGQIIAKCSVIRSKGKKDWVQIKITDTGIGIKEENIKLIFEEFSRISAEDNRHYEGTGLGLAITKKIVELLNGKIFIESQFGKGSSFIVVLPLTILPGKIAEDSTKITKHSVHKITFNKEKVLLTDDDQFLLELTTLILREANLDVIPFSNPVNAKNAIINHQEFDLLITDIQMPGMNGFELLSYFRQNNLSPAKAIAITGNITEEETFKKAGFTGVLRKPFQPEQLLEIIAEELKGVYTTLSNDSNHSNNNDNPTSGPIAEEQYSIEGIKAYTGDDEETFREVLLSFALTTSQNIKLFRGFIQNKNYEEITKLAHKMLPMYRQLKAEEIVETLLNFERKKFDPMVTEQWMGKGSDVINKIERMMEDIIFKYQLPFSGKLIS
jgi:signal transduction histidine kinase/CheY-like chemotaxis protein